MNKVKSINNDIKVYFVLCIIAAVILNALTFFIPQKHVSYVTIAVNFIPVAMMIIFLNGVWSAFTLDKLYVHVVPISKKRIYFDIFFKWIISYTLVCLIKVIFISLKVDLSYLIQNVNIYGLLFDMFVNYINGVYLGVFLSSIILVIKMYKGKGWIFIIIFLALTGLPSSSKDADYTYKNNISMSTLEMSRVAITKTEQAGINVNINNQEISLEPWMREENVSYKGLILWGIPLLALLFYGVRNIEKISIES